MKKAIAILVLLVGCTEEPTIRALPPPPHRAPAPLAPLRALPPPPHLAPLPVASDAGVYSDAG